MDFKRRTLTAGLWPDTTRQLACASVSHDWCTSLGVPQAEASERRLTCDERHLVVELHALQHVVVQRPSCDLILLSTLIPAAQMTPSRHSACARSGCPLGLLTHQKSMPAPPPSSSLCKAHRMMQGASQSGCSWLRVFLAGCVATSMPCMTWTLLSIHLSARMQAEVMWNSILTQGSLAGACTFW